jgi:hypothetical protein
MSNSMGLAGLLPEPHGNATFLANPDLFCSLATCDLTLAHFSYLPSLPGNALYTAIFAGCFAVQVLLGIKYRTWGFMIATVCIFSKFIPLFGWLASCGTFKILPFLNTSSVEQINKY